MSTESERERLKQTSALPMVQAVLEHFGMECSKAESVARWVGGLASFGAASDNASRFLAKCESPVERQFALGAFQPWKTYRPIPAEDGCALLHGEGRDIAIVPQMTFRDLDWACNQCESPCDCEPPDVARVDFVFVTKVRFDVTIAIGVEIDGHDFHEKTKEQATRDKRRDRSLLSLAGSPSVLIRFTGSEVFEDPFGCFGAAMDFLESRIERHDRLITFLLANGLTEATKQLAAAE